MKIEKRLKFQDQEYFDDRLFVLYLCKGIVNFTSDGFVDTTIYHEQSPPESIWCVVTYRNSNRYPLFSVTHFRKREDAVSYIKTIEPTTPLVCLNGKSPETPFSYEEYLLWKNENNMLDYNWESLYSEDGKNAQEVVTQTKDQFKGIR